MSSKIYFFDVYVSINFANCHVLLFFNYFYKNTWPYLNNAYWMYIKCNLSAMYVHTNENHIS